MSDANIEINLNAKGNLNDKLDQASKSSAKLDKSLEGLKGAFSGVVGTVFSLKGALAAAVAGFSVKKFIDAASESEDSINKLNIALAQTGIYSKETSKEFQDLASQLQETTRFEDDTIVKTAALIQSLGKLDKDGLKKATIAAADLSAGLGIDLSSAATLVGKAAVGEVASFKKLGIEITKGATDGETLANALSKINENFGGRASADAKTFSGSIEQLKNAYGDMFEEIGKSFTQSSGLKAIISTIGSVVKQATEVIIFNRGKFIDALNGVIGSTFTFLRAVTSAFDAVVRVTKATFSTLVSIFKTTEGALKLITGDFAGFKKAALESAAASKDIGKALLSEALPDVQEFLITTESMFSKTANKIEKETEDTVKNIVQTVKKESVFDFLLSKAGQIGTTISAAVKEFETGGMGGFLRGEAGQKITAAAGSAAGFLQQGAKGAAGALAAGADMLAPGLGQVVQLLSMSKEDLKLAIRSFIDAFPLLLETILMNLPVIIEELVAGIPRLVDAFIDRMPQIFVAFQRGMIESAPKIAEALIKSIADTATGGVFSGGGGIFGSIGSAFGFSEGGVTPNSGPSGKDIYPSMLSRGERVLTQQQNNVFESLLSAVQKLGSAQMGVDNRPIQVKSSVKVNQRELANIMLDLSRANVRTA